MKRLFVGILMVGLIMAFSGVSQAATVIPREIANGIHKFIGIKWGTPIEYFIDIEYSKNRDKNGIKTYDYRHRTRLFFTDGKFCGYAKPWAITEKGLTKLYKSRTQQYGKPNKASKKDGKRIEIWAHKNSVLVIKARKMKIKDKVRYVVTEFVFSRHAFSRYFGKAK